MREWLARYETLVPLRSVTLAASCALSPGHVSLLRKYSGRYSPIKANRKAETLVRDGCEMFNYLDEMYY